MRAFILIALLAMATTVSSQSAACNSAVTALDNNATVTQADAWIVKGGCSELNFNDTQCPPVAGDVTNCQCAQTYDNKTAWESAVVGAGGRVCYMNFAFTIVGTNNSTVPAREVRLIVSQTGLANVAVPNICNDTEIKTTLAAGVSKAVTLLNSVVTSVQKTNVTWTTGTVTVSACTATVTETRTFSAGGSATTSPPTTPAPSGTTPPPSGTTQPPTSTGKNGASIIASSVALVASLIAAVTILA